jgi:hypothetical protein
MGSSALPGYAGPRISCLCVCVCRRKFVYTQVAIRQVKRQHTTHGVETHLAAGRSDESPRQFEVASHDWSRKF